ncbi:Biopterin transporter family [Trypanosoma melophagium]|uniref:Biopterin transporter family n=1 Tax=Trypanosoma melophagium TaxID=715481 RepID=UPI00351A7237|nr:Biopterin transporter family [Trypanosoma melophagium]
MSRQEANSEGRGARDGNVSSNSDDPAPPLSNEMVSDPRYIHPEAKEFFANKGFLRYIPLFGEAVEGYGPKPVFSIAMSYFMCKGVSDYLVRLSLFAMFTRRYGVDGITYQRLENVGMLGWSIKPLAAVVSDMFAFFGYSKRWYMFAACILGSPLSLVFGLLPATTTSAQVASGLVFVNCFSKALVDILLEGHYSRMLRRVPGPGPALVSWIWCFIMAGSLVATVVVGPLGDAGYPQVAAFLATGFQLATAFFFLFNWIGELPNRVERLEDARLLHEDSLKLQSLTQEVPLKDMKPEEQNDGGAAEPALDSGNMAEYDDAVPYGLQENAVMPFEFQEPWPCCCGVFEVNKEVMRRNLRVSAYCILITCCVVVVAVVSIVGTRSNRLCTVVSVSIVLCGFNFYALPLTIAKANLFGYLQKTLILRFPGAISTFYTAGPDCVPGGPHFSLSFYQTVAGIIGVVASIGGITLFNYIFSKRTYWLTFIVTSFLVILANLFDLIVVMRWNRPRVSDHVVFILGDAVFSEAVNMLGWMPMIVLLSRLCPRGSESTVYAIVAASANLGQSMASVIGTLIMEYLLPVATKPPCDYSNLKWIIVVGGFCVPLLQIPLVFLLIPRARICDNLNDVNFPNAVQAEMSEEKNLSKSADDENPASPGVEQWSVTNRSNEKL